MKWGHQNVSTVNYRSPHLRLACYTYHMSSFEWYSHHCCFIDTLQSVSAEVTRSVGFLLLNDDKQKKGWNIPTALSLSHGETVGNFSNTWAYSRRNICIWQTRLGFFGSLLLPSNIHKFNFQSALLLLVWVLLNEIASSYYNILPGPANVARSWYSNSITWPVLSAWH